MPIMRVQAKRPGNELWMTWTEDRITGLVGSLDALREKAVEWGCETRDIRWEFPAYDEMVAAGVAPKEPPADFL